MSNNIYKRLWHYGFRKTFALLYIFIFINTYKTVAAFIAAKE